MVGGGISDVQAAPLCRGVFGLFAAAVLSPGSDNVKADCMDILLLSEALSTPCENISIAPLSSI